MLAGWLRGKDAFDFMVGSAGLLFLILSLFLLLVGLLCELINRTGNFRSLASLKTIVE
jgi:hypothetical protein